MYGSQAFCSALRERNMGELGTGCHGSTEALGSSLVGGVGEAE